MEWGICIGWDGDSKTKPLGVTGRDKPGLAPCPGISHQSRCSGAGKDLNFSGETSAGGCGPSRNWRICKMKNEKKKKRKIKAFKHFPVRCFHTRLRFLAPEITVKEIRQGEFGAFSLLSPVGKLLFVQVDWFHMDASNFSCTCRMLLNLFLFFLVLRTF